MEKKILVVDDELNMRNLLYSVFSKEGYKVLTALEGEEAVEIVRKEKPDLMLLDIRMPKLDGIETLKRIREFDNRIKIIILTAVGTAELERQARLNGACGFLKKPFDVYGITNVVKQILWERPELGNEGKKILVVDDNPKICAVLKAFLSNRGYSPIIAASGEEALEKIKTAKPIIVLLDIKMPGMDGLMTLKRIKGINEDIGVIMITGVEDENIGEEAMKLGAYDYIRKPFDLDYLEMCLFTKIILLSA